MASRKTISIIVVGDEILSGQIFDRNSQFLCKELDKMGAKVAKLSVVPQDVDAVAEEVRLHSEKYTYVIISGVKGHIYDDVTFEAMAKAFDEKIVFNKELEKVLTAICLRWKFDLLAGYRNSHVPQSSEFHYVRSSNKEILFPVISVKNVFAFTITPKYLKLAFNQLKSLFSDCTPYFTRILYVEDSKEFTVSNVLNMAVKEFGEVVNFGTYPDVENPYYQVKITVGGASKESVYNAEGFLRSHLPSNSAVGHFHPNSKEALIEFQKIFNRRVKTFDEDFFNKVVTSLEILNNMMCHYSLCRISFNGQFVFKNVCISFNGGKDCTALLHLTHNFIEKFYSDKSHKLKAVYIRPKKPFSETEEFIDLCVER